MAEAYLLAADVGGTKTEMVLAHRSAGRAGVVWRHEYASQRFSALDAIIDDFLHRPEVESCSGRIGAACFAVAGPVQDGEARLTNLDWRLNEGLLSASHNLPRVSLINDFAAVGLGISHLQPDELVTLQAGRVEESGNRVVIGAGTGLGVALLIREAGRYRVHDSEGGHADFAPVDVVQDRLLRYLRTSFGRVSYERVISGPGLLRIFSFLQEDGAGAPSRALAEALRGSCDPAGTIAEFALNKADLLAVRTLELFVAAYGAFAGNVALATLPRGGLYIAGGIAPRIMARMTDGAFVRAFTAKGRFSDLLATLPVQVILNRQVGVLGAMDQADRL